MNNLEKLTNVFVISFDINEKDVEFAVYKQIPLWDSVGQMTLVTNIEDEFHIAITPQDIMAIKSFSTAKQVLSENYNITF